MTKRSRRSGQRSPRKNRSGLITLWMRATAPHPTSPQLGPIAQQRASAADEVQDIAVRVLEPGDLHVAGDMDVAFAAHAGPVIMLERDALRGQSFGQLRDAVADRPGHRRRLI